MRQFSLSIMCVCEVFAGRKTPSCRGNKERVSQICCLFLVPSSAREAGVAIAAHFTFLHTFKSKGVIIGAIDRSRGHSSSASFTPPHVGDEI